MTSYYKSLKENNISSKKETEEPFYEHFVSYPLQ